MAGVFCAIDTPNLEQAVTMATRIQASVQGIKLGLEFFLAQGAAGYRHMAQIGLPIFLDLKLHDIPNTVAGAMRSLLPLGPAFITVHTSGGAAMMRAAADAARQAGAARPQILGVTVLTCLDSADLAAIGQDTDAVAQVVRLAKLAKDSGLDGVICSPAEIAPLRAALGPDFILMVPGIRPEGSASGDQKRVMTPRQAAEAGADYLVIGRPITEAADPAEAAQRIAAEMA